VLARSFSTWPEQSLCRHGADRQTPDEDHLLRRAAEEMVAGSALGEHVEKRIGLDDPHRAQNIGAGVQFVRAEAAEFGLDRERIGLIGASADAHLSPLAALAGKEPLVSGDYLADRHSVTSAEVKAVIGFYGVYDMQAQWEHDQMTRPRDQITEKFLGAAPMTSRKLFFEASPLSYVTVDKNSTRFLLIYGREDDIVDPATQSEKFLTALKQAGFFARTIVVPGAGHFWASDR
jgi:acetyl esterase/lipase